MSWLNLHKKPFTECQEKFYHLSTGRFVSHVPDHCYGLRNIRVVGSVAEVTDFWLLNETCLQGKSLHDYLYEPCKDFSTLISQHHHQRGKTGPPAIIHTTDVSKLTDEQLHHLNVFNFNGCFLKAKVVKVIDGDTIDVAVYVTLKDLATTWTHDGHVHTSILLSEDTSSGFFTVVRLRLFGLDTPEINTELGKVSSKLFEERLVALQNIIWVEFLENDKYGRSLALLYADHEKKELLNNYLFEESCRQKKVLVNHYQGGKKDHF